MFTRQSELLLKLLLCFSLSGTAWAAPGFPKEVLLDGPAWRVAPEGDVKESGELISKIDFAAQNWIPAQVPGTVFGAYVSAGLEKEPSYGDNCYRVDPSKYDRNFWYRTTFSVPVDDAKGKRWLILDGVNRDADIFVNGRKLGSMAGFMQRGRFDVTKVVQVGDRNALAVLDHWPNQPKGKKENYSSPALVGSKGWDWMPYVPGLNMGIFQSVRLERTGALSLLDPWIRVELPSPAAADLSLQVTVENASTGAVTGHLTGTIRPGEITLSVPVSLAAGETKVITLTSSTIPALHLLNPKLWWPNGYGDPNLYTCEVNLETNGTISDAKTVTFGVRKYTYDTAGNVLRFKINGLPIYPKGGAWGMPEFMLRCKASDYDVMLRLQKATHFNMVRNWMGMTTAPAFYDACDKYGMMVWDEFWLNSSGGLPERPELFRANTIEKIKAVRNHPCIALWCGDNEATPPAPLNDWLRQDIETHDGGDRYYQPNSHDGAISGSGPWGNRDPKSYFLGTRPAWGGRDSGAVAFGMRSEIGTATFTSFDSFKRFMPQKDWWPRNDMWNKHFFGALAPNATPREYDRSLRNSYGAPQNIQEYCAKAQFLNLETMKAIYEGWLDHSDKDSSGVLIWMSQSAYPSFVWQTYDYYYDTTGAYWGARTACEPVHLYWNPANDLIRVVNTSGKNVDELMAEGWIYNMDGTQKFYRAANVSTRHDAVMDCFRLEYPDDLSPTHFIKLRLTAPAGAVVSENFYWRGTKHLDYTALNEMKKVELAISQLAVSQANGMETMSVSITNPANSGTVAFGIRPKLVDPSTKELVAPVFMEDGYFSLTPGETKSLNLQFDAAGLQGRRPALVVESWNNFVKPAALPEGRELGAGKMVTASSTDPAAGLPETVVQPRSQKRWASETSSEPQWICIDLGETRTINRVVLDWEAAYATAYKIQVSDNGTTWKDIYQTTSGWGDVEVLKNLDGQGRYVRVHATQRATKYGYSLYSIKIFGPKP